MDLLSHLRTFVDIVDHGSLAAVARHRGQSASTVTSALQRLEEHVGTRLIVRTTRSMALTVDGARFLADSRRILAEVDGALERVADRGPLAGPIRVSALNDFGRRTLAGLVDGFLRDHPGVHVELVLSDGLVDLIDDGFDLAVRTGPLADSRLTARLLQRSRRVIAASPAYWEAHGRPQHPRELSEHNCLVLARPGHPQRTWTFHDGEELLHVTVHGDRTANAGGLLRQWAVDGAGVLLKSDYDVREDIAAGRLQTALDDYTRAPVHLYAVHPSGRQPSRRVAALIDYLATHLGKTQGEQGHGHTGQTSTFLG